jgi:GntR family transcriptional regulator
MALAKTTPVFLSVSAADPRSITRQITDGVRMAIAAGKLPVGAQLPSVRGLAEQLTVNPKTVARAYDELVGQGWLHARQGLGLFVAEPRQRLSESERERRLRTALDAFAADVVGLGFPLDEVLDRVRLRLEPVLRRRAG